MEEEEERRRRLGQQEAEKSVKWMDGGQVSFCFSPTNSIG
jgi:hypothetical protein